jgi:hypothetical protein
MKYLLLITFLSAFTSGFHRIAEVNKLKENAETAYRANDFKKSSEFYYILLNEYGMQDEYIRMNLAHSYFKSQDRRKKAEEHYKILTRSQNRKIRATAFQQLGVLAAMKGKNQIAINYFIQSLKTDPSNENARYNYEMIKKIQRLQMEEEEDKVKRKGEDKKEKGSINPGTNQEETLIKIGNESGNNETSMDEEKENGDLRMKGEEGEGKGNRIKEYDGMGENSHDQKVDDAGNNKGDALRVKRLSQVNLNEDKAKLILESMKNEEIQYLQQLRKNIYNRNYKNKPDW